MKCVFCFVLVGSCVSIAALAQGPKGGGGPNCNVTCKDIVDFYTYVTDPVDGKYPWYAFHNLDGPCRRLWRIDSTQLKDPQGNTTEKRYGYVSTDVPRCTPTPSDNSAAITQASFVEPSETWTTTCYERCDDRP